MEDTSRVQMQMVIWHSVEHRLPTEPGEYLVTYHPCYWGDISESKEVGLDTFRGKSTWAKRKYQRVIAWAYKPIPYKEAKDEDFGGR